MNYNILSLITLVTLVAFAALWHVKVKTKPYVLPYSVKTLEGLKNFFPKTSEDLQAISKQALGEAQQAVERLIARPAEQRTVKNTLYGLDTALSHYREALALFELFVLIQPNDALRTESEKESIFFQQKFVDLFGQNKKLYLVMKEFNETHGKDLTSQEKYFLDELLSDYERSGLKLPDDIREKVIALQKELAELCTEFEKNIATDATTITVNTKDELDGLDDSIIEGLKRTDDGKYILGTDYPTFFAVRSFAHNSDVRKRLHEAFYNRAYPINKPILEKIIQKRFELAQLLGFKTFAELALAGEMVKTPERAQTFLNDLLEKVNKKEASEFKQFTESLPKSVQLSEQGKLHPADKWYLIEQYKKNHYNLDENEITNYFPVDKTLNELLSIYQQFLNITFKEESLAGFWHPDVRLISVYNNNQFVGYLLLDLYPRPNKYKHACQTTIIPVQKTADGTIEPGLAVVIANFPKATSTQPALLSRRDVVTFFHEFGHALHALLGATHLANTSGTNVKTDFVEMPSQMLEEWLNDKEILKKVSSHYKTGEPLPDDIITKITDLKNLHSGSDQQRQILFAKLSLNLHNQKDSVNIDELNKNVWDAVMAHEEYNPKLHFYSSFGHLTGYSAKYYSYLWSKVFALDLFDTIKKIGLLNPEIGVKYKNTILAPGGSKDPNELLKDFLGREPNNTAFMKDLGL